MRVWPPPRPPADKPPKPAGGWEFSMGHAKGPAAGVPLTFLGTPSRTSGPHGCCELLGLR